MGIKMAVPSELPNNLAIPYARPDKKLFSKVVHTQLLPDERQSFVSAPRDTFLRDFKRPKVIWDNG